ncbi:MAG TPA: hypothetical protein VK395_23550 [Gemmataceae bacterium]|nr:hypothetical protein [Gemmataceae bacterium]
MRGLATCVLAIALGAGICASSLHAADDDDTDSAKAKPSPSPLGFHWDPVFAHAVGMDQNPTPQKKPPDKTPKPAAKKTDTAHKLVSVAEQTAALRAREEAALLRRLAVCDKLKEIALRTNDNDLLRHAEELDERARMTYSLHTAMLKNVNVATNMDEQILERHLGTPAAAKGSLEEAAVYTASGTDQTGRAVVREENR